MSLRFSFWFLFSCFFDVGVDRFLKFLNIGNALAVGI